MPQLPPDAMSTGDLNVAIVNAYEPLDDRSIEIVTAVEIFAIVPIQAVKIRFTDVSVSATRHDAMPIEVIPLEGTDEFLTLDNTRLCSRRNSYGETANIPCIVRDPAGRVPSVMSDYYRDILEVGWFSGEKFHKVTLKANELWAVFLIRCCQQSSTFPLDGRQQIPEMHLKPSDKDQFILGEVFDLDSRL